MLAKEQTRASIVRNGEQLDELQDLGTRVIERDKRLASERRERGIVSTGTLPDFGVVKRGARYRDTAGVRLIDQERGDVFRADVAAIRSRQADGDVQCILSAVAPADGLLEE